MWKIFPICAGNGEMVPESCLQKRVASLLRRQVDRLKKFSLLSSSWSVGWKQHVFGHAALEFWKTTLNMREILKGLLWIAHLQILKDVRDRISWNCDTVWHPGGSWDIVKSHCTTSFGQRRRDEQSLGSGWWRGSLWRLRVLFRHRLWHRLHKRAKKCKEWFCSILNGGLALIASYCFNLGISWAFLSFESPACSEAAAHLIFWPSAGGASPTKFGNRAQWGWEKFANASVTQLGSIKQWHVHACTVEVLSKGILGYLWHKAKKPWALKLRERSAKVKFSWIVPEIQSSRKSEKGWNSVLSTSHKCSTTLVFTQVSYSFVQRKPPQNWTWTKWKSLIFGQVYCGESGHFCSPSKWEATLTDRTS